MEGGKCEKEKRRRCREATTEARMEEDRRRRMKMGRIRKEEEMGEKRLAGGGREKEM